MGRDVALSLARAGSDVGVIARTGADLEDTAQAVRALGRRAVATVGDVGDPDDIRRFGSEVRAEFGTVDLIVSNAGNLLYKPLVPLPGMRAIDPSFHTPISEEEWHSVFRTHVDGAFHVLREFVPGMLDAGRGRVVIIASNVVERLIPFCSAYDAAKGALVQMARSYAMEWARHGVTVNAIAPGHFPSAMSHEQLTDPALRDWVLKRIPMRRTGSSDELAALVTFLASDAAGYLTGQVITLDGGESL